MKGKYIGACKYCGQTIAEASFETQEAADIEATNRCTCDKATYEREMRERIEKAEANIDQLFGWGAGNNGFSQLEPDLVEDLKDKARRCGNRGIKSCTIVLKNGEVAQIRAGQAEIKVKRSKTIKAEL